MFFRSAGMPVPAGGVTVLDLETRRLSRAAAVQRAIRAGRWLKRAGVRPGYFKIDSTLRGHPVAEAEAIRVATGRRLIWFVPANPSMGRTTVGGHQFVHGEALESTAYVRDPLHPVKTGDLLELAAKELGGRACAHLPLAELGRGAAHVRSLRRGWLGGGVRLVVADIVRESDLARLAACIPADDLAVGAAALAAHLFGRPGSPAVRASARTAQASPLVSRGLAVIGSLNPLTATQVARAGGLRGVRVRRLASDDLRRGIAVPAAPECRWLILALDPARFRRLLAARSWQGERIARGLARLAAKASALRAPDVLLLSGGLTAAAVCEAMGIPELRLRREVEAGLVASEADGPAGRLTVLTKPGGFGSKDALAVIMRGGRT